MKRSLNLVSSILKAPCNDLARGFFLSASRLFYRIALIYYHFSARHTPIALHIQAAAQAFFTPPPFCGRISAIIIHQIEQVALVAGAMRALQTTFPTRLSTHSLEYPTAARNLPRQVTENHAHHARLNLYSIIDFTL